MELKLVPKLQLGVVMTPQLKMAIKLLTLNHLELKDAVAQELVENPVLEEAFDDRVPNESREVEVPVASPTPERPPEVSSQPTQQEPQVDWEAYADSYNYLPPSAGSGGGDSFDDLPGLDQTLTRSETLEEHLLWQVRMSDMSSLEREIGKICRKVVKTLLLKKDEKKVQVTPKNLDKFLGVRRFSFGIAEKKNQIGQVNGLAWTEVGGELLSI